MNDFSDLASKAELRRKKILENSQKRLDRVLGKSDTLMNSPKSSEAVAKEESALNNGTANGLLLNGTPNLNEVLANQSKSNVDVHIHSKSNVEEKEELPRVQIKDVYKPDSTDASLVTPGSTDRKTKDSDCSIGKWNDLKLEFDPTPHLSHVDRSRSPDQLKESRNVVLWSYVQYVVLAILVRCMLYLQCGWMFGELILVPFVITESVQVSLGYVHTSRYIQMLAQLITFCGFSVHEVQSITKAITILIHCLEDFNVYFVTFCLLHLCFAQEATWS